MNNVNGVTKVLVQLALRLAVALLPSLESWLQSMLTSTPPMSVNPMLHKEMQKTFSFMLKK